jgi:hypothetical protein
MAEKVSKRRLREIWDEPRFQAEFLQRTQQRVDVSENLAPPDANQVPGTMSHVYDFVNNDQHELLGTFHAYIEPGGVIGASGMYDPIFLLVDGVPYVDP